MAYEVRKGATLLVPSGPSGNHLYVVVTEPDENDQVLVVTFCSIPEQGFHDATCEIHEGHPFVTRPTYVNYRLSEIMTCAHIEKCVDGWVYTPKQSIDDDELMTRMRDGILDSELTPQRIQTYFQTRIAEE